MLTALRGHAEGLWVLFTDVIYADFHAHSGQWAWHPVRFLTSSPLTPRPLSMLCCRKTRAPDVQPLSTLSPPNPTIDPDKQRAFATEVVVTLRAAGYEAYWAGGCVRDQLLGRTPHDYDIATDARPEQIQHVFSRRKTLAIGAAFGVITVLGSRGAGQIEVATFRQDLGYSDGRRPDSVRYSSAREDAARRDFTINGMFYDPVAEQVIDYVGGQDDLHRRQIRSIGSSQARFEEDKLRLLRAVRFAAVLDFSLDSATTEAIARMAEQIQVVSAERIAAEMRTMLVRSGRERALQLLSDVGLLPIVLPEAAKALAASETGCELFRIKSLLAALDSPSFSLSLAVVLSAVPDVNRALTLHVGARWKLSNKEIEQTAWLIEHRDTLWNAQTIPWSQLQPVLIDESAHELLTWHKAVAANDGRDHASLQWCRERLAWPREQLDPAPLITGADLIGEGIPRGRVYAEILNWVRSLQLDGELMTSKQAMDFVRDAYP